MNSCSEVMKTCSNVEELISLNRLEEAYSCLYRFVTGIGNRPTGLEKIVTKYAQSLYFKSLKQLDNAIGCCRNVLELPLSKPEEYKYSSKTCLLYCNLLIEKQNYLEALEISDIGLNHSKKSLDPEFQLEITENFQSVNECISKNLHKFANGLNGKSASQKKKKKIIQKSSHINKLFTTSQSKYCGILPNISSKSPKIRSYKPQNNQNLPKLTEKRSYFNRTAQEIILSRASAFQTSELSNSLQVLISKFLIKELRNSKSVKRKTAEAKATKALIRLEFLKTEYAKSNRRIFSSFESKFASDLATIPESN